MDNKNKKLVVKHNKLIEFKGRMSVNELKLFSLIIAEAREQQVRTLQKYHIDISSLKDTTKHKDFYGYIKEIAFKLEQKRIEVETKNSEGNRVSYPIRLIYRPTITEKSKYLELYLDKELIPYILDLKKEFTRYQIENILSLKSGYSIRIYELVKQYQIIKKRTFTVENLRNYLGIQKEEYDRFFDFEKRVLEVAEREINEYTDLNISYTKNKSGRSISSITFTIESKEDDAYITYLNENYNIKEFKEKSGLCDENFDSKQIIELYSVACGKLENEYDTADDMFEYIRLNYLHMIKNKTVKNKYAYLKKALAEDYAVARAQIKFDYKII